MRLGGILLHISSLPGPDGIGSLGPEAYAFADFLKEAGMTIWQVLPMGPTGYGESPYQSTGVQAGNPMLISVDQLAKEGLIDLTGMTRFVPEKDDQVDFERVNPAKTALLREAFRQSEKKLSSEIAAFVADNDWVKPFALFTALKNKFDRVKWTLWPDEKARKRDPEAIAAYEKELDEEIRFHIWCQYVFDRQWMALKAYCNGLNIRLFGDMPIYVAEDSMDTWLHPEVFQLNEDGEPRNVAGVPPDYFSKDGQLWGNPLYRWTELKKRGYDWWIERMRRMNHLYDIVRVDHFIGFANYYSIPHGAPNARKGRWIAGPDKALFKALKTALPGMDVVAEDLGVVNDRVKNLIAWTGYPGMRVLQFAFAGDDTNEHLPDNISENTAYYTGTHDNVTALAWAKAAGKEELAKARKICGFTTADKAPWAMIKTVMMSKARIAVCPMQDVLCLDDDATMNRPGIIGGNWQWRLKEGQATEEIAKRLRKLIDESQRNAQ